MKKEKTCKEVGVNMEIKSILTELYHDSRERCWTSSELVNDSLLYILESIKKEAEGLIKVNSSDGYRKAIQDLIVKLGI